MVHVLNWLLVLTRHPVVVQLSLIILLLRAECLQSQLQLLSVQRVFDAQLLNIHKENIFKANVPAVLCCKFNSKNALAVWLLVLDYLNSCFIAPSPDPVVRPVEASDQKRSIREPCLRTDRDPAPAASYTPAPLTSVQKEHQHH